MSVVPVSSGGVRASSSLTSVQIAEGLRVSRRVRMVASGSWRVTKPARTSVSSGPWTLEELTMRVRAMSVWLNVPLPSAMTKATARNRFSPNTIRESTLSESRGPDISRSYERYENLVTGYGAPTGIDCKLWL